MASRLNSCLICRITVKLSDAKRDRDTERQSRVKLVNAAVATLSCVEQCIGLVFVAP